MSDPERCGNEFTLKHGYFCELPKGHEGAHGSECPNPQYWQAWPKDQPAGDPPEVDEPKCFSCGQTYVTWFTDNAIWNKCFTNPEGGKCCPNCFLKIAEGFIKCTGWKIMPENEPSQPAPEPLRHKLENPMDPECSPCARNCPACAEKRNAPEGAAERLKREAVLGDLVNMQRSRDHWREYAYGNRDKPSDYLDGNKVNRGETALERAEHLLSLADKVVVWARAYSFKGSPLDKSLAEYDRAKAKVE
jgi:hypothetical protein